MRSAVNEVAHEPGLDRQRVAVILNPVKAKADEANAAIQRACLAAGWDEPRFFETTRRTPATHRPERRWSTGPTSSSWAAATVPCAWWPRRWRTPGCHGPDSAGNREPAGPQRGPGRLRPARQRPDRALWPPAATSTPHGWKSKTPAPAHSSSTHSWSSPASAWTPRSWVTRTTASRKPSAGLPTPRRGSGTCPGAGRRSPSRWMTSRTSPEDPHRAVCQLRAGSRRHRLHPAGDDRRRHTGRGGHEPPQCRGLARDVRQDPVQAQAAPARHDRYRSGKVVIRSPEPMPRSSTATRPGMATKVTVQVEPGPCWSGQGGTAGLSARAGLPRLACRCLAASSAAAFAAPGLGLLADHGLFLFEAQAVRTVGLVPVPVLVSAVGLGLTIIPWPSLSSSGSDMTRSFRWGHPLVDQASIRTVNRGGSARGAFIYAVGEAPPAFRARIRRRVSL